MSSFSRLGRFRFDSRFQSMQQENQMLSTILIVILVLMLFGTLPTWGHSRSWGYTPSGAVGLVLLVLVVALLAGRL